MLKLICFFILSFFSVYVITISNKINKYAIQLKNPIGIIPFDGIEYILDKPLCIQVNNREITIPQGFKTDLASIPRLLWPLFSPNESDTVYPAILHDYLYTCGGWVRRKYADDVLYAFLLERGYPKYKAFPFYLVARIFGSTHFQKRNDKCEFTYIRK